MYQIKSADGVVRYSTHLCELLLKYFYDMKDDHDGIEIWYNNRCCMKFTSHEEDEYFDDEENWGWEG